MAIGGLGEIHLTLFLALHTARIASVRVVKGFRVCRTRFRSLTQGHRAEILSVRPTQDPVPQHFPLNAPSMTLHVVHIYI